MVDPPLEDWTSRITFARTGRYFCLGIVDALCAHHPVLQAQRDALDELAEIWPRKVCLEDVFAHLVGYHSDVCLKGLAFCSSISKAEALKRRNFPLLLQTLVDASWGVAKPANKKTYKMESFLLRKPIL